MMNLADIVIDSALALALCLILNIHDSHMPDAATFAISWLITSAIFVGVHTYFKSIEYTDLGN